MEDNTQAIVPTTFDTELIEQLGISELHLKNPDTFFSLIEKKLPISGSMAIGGKLLCTKEKGYSSEDWIKIIDSALSSYVKNRLQQDLSAIVVGDNMINYAYVISYEFFMNNFWSFFSIPQDTYVILEKDKLCFQYTYEDELFVHRFQ